MACLFFVSPAYAKAPIVPLVELESGKQNLLPYIYSPLENRVVYLESRYVVNAVGDHGLAYGPCQFHQSTFYRIKQAAINKGTGLYYLEYKNAADQLVLCNWALNNGYGQEWSTYKKAIEGVSNESNHP